MAEEPKRETLHEQEEGVEIPEPTEDEIREWFSKGWRESESSLKMLRMLDQGKIVVDIQKMKLFALACSRRSQNLQNLLEDERNERSDRAIDAIADVIEERMPEEELWRRFNPNDFTLDARARAFLQYMNHPENHNELSMLLQSNATCWAHAQVDYRQDPSWGERYRDEEKEQTHLFREVLGDPFMGPPKIEKSWLLWDGGTVTKLARVIYEERNFDEMLVLADALEDAGCANVDILAHCRGPNNHARGCWVIDLLLGKE